MKLATYKDGSRDGQLVLVARDLATAHHAQRIATRMQQVLDDWNFLSPQLQDLYEALNAGRTRHAFPFDPALCMAPLPRAYQRVEGGPGLRQTSGDNLLGPCDELPWFGDDQGQEVQAQLAVITGEVPMGSAKDQALEGVRLVMLAHSVWLHRVVEQTPDPHEGLLRGQPATAFSPVAVTLDELGTAWQGGQIHLSLQSSRNGRKSEAVDVAQVMKKRHFGHLIAQLCSKRPVRAGSIVGSGPLVAPQAPQGKSREANPLRQGDCMHTEMTGQEGPSVFGALTQRVGASPPEVAG